MCRPPGLEMMMASGPVADATGKDIPPSGLVWFAELEWSRIKAAENRTLPSGRG